MSSIATIKNIAMPQKGIRMQVGSGQGSMQGAGLIADFIGFMLNHAIDALLEVTGTETKGNDNCHDYQSSQGD